MSSEWIFNHRMVRPSASSFWLSDNFFLYKRYKYSLSLVWKRGGELVTSISRMRSSYLVVLEGDSFFLEGVHFINLIKVYNRGLQAHGYRMEIDLSKLSNAYIVLVTGLTHGLPCCTVFQFYTLYFFYNVGETRSIFIIEKQWFYHTMTIRFDHN